MRLCTRRDIRKSGRPAGGGGLISRLPGELAPTHLLRLLQRVTDLTHDAFESLDFVLEREAPGGEVGPDDAGLVCAAWSVRAVSSRARRALRTHFVVTDVGLVALQGGPRPVEPDPDVPHRERARLGEVNVLPQQPGLLAPNAGSIRQPRRPRRLVPLLDALGVLALERAEELVCGVGGARRGGDRVVERDEQGRERVGDAVEEGLEEMLKVLAFFGRDALVRVGEGREERLEAGKVVPGRVVGGE